MITIQRNVILGFLLLVSIELAFIFYYNQGVFIYALDDPYIHLRLAENIGRYFNYGINPNEFSAPSSSIVWPFLLSLFAHSPFFTWAPFILTTLFSVGAIFYFLKIIDLLFPAQLKLLRYLFSIIFTLATNLIPMIFIGMEHDLQIFVCVLLMYALIQALYLNCPFPKWGTFLIVLAPLVRYELTTFSLLLILFLLWRRDYKTASLALLALVLALSAFSFFLLKHGDILLPNSVLKKAHFNLLNNIPSLDFTSMRHRFTRILSIILYTPLTGAFLYPLYYFTYLFLLTTAFIFNIRSKDIVCVSGLAFILYFVQLYFGYLDFYDRYNVYLSAIILPALLYSFHQALIALFSKKPWYYVVIFTALCAHVYAYNFSCLFSIELASHSIYAQQYQMHRAITEYCPVNIAVNDLGLTSLHNSHYVLDLYGLGNTTALKARNNPKSLQKLVTEHQVKLVMIYPDWFSPKVSVNWTPLGILESKERGSAAFTKVYFYAANKGDTLALKTCLQSFSKTLPKDDKFIFIAQ